MAFLIICIENDDGLMMNQSFGTVFRKFSPRNPSYGKFTTTFTRWLLFHVDFVHFQANGDLAK
jgi:hypothetical protein